jgi:TatD DNase family protein
MLRRTFSLVGFIHSRTLSTDLHSTLTQRRVFVDTHCHLDYISGQLKPKPARLLFTRIEKEISAVLKDSRTPPDCKFAGCVAIACKIQSFAPILSLLTHDLVHGSFGIHPHYASSYNDDVHARLLELQKHPKVVAWGEVGLDYNRLMSPKDVQQTVFRRQCRAAVEVGKPLVVHTREAEADTLSILKAELPNDWKIHVHCFTDSAVFAKHLLGSFPNLFLGFTGAITFNNANKLREVIKQVPLSRILLETDGPYMTPEPMRGNPAHPGHIPLIAKAIADIKRETIDEVLMQCRQNTTKMYGF